MVDLLKNIVVRYTPLLPFFFEKLGDLAGFHKQLTLHLRVSVIRPWFL